MNINVEKVNTIKGEVKLITITNEKKFSVSFVDYGAAVYSISYKDKKGNIGIVTCALKDINSFISSSNNYGKAIGPVAIRIKNAEANIDGVTYHFDKNEHENTLHSGSASFGNKFYAYQINLTDKKVDLIFTLDKKDMDGGFPGNGKIKVVYTIYENKNELNIKFSAKVDKPTLMNMTSHIYFNLNGGKESIYNQILTINANKVARFDDHLIIQGFDNVSDLLDFRDGKELRESVTSKVLLDGPTHGLDHIFLLNEVNKNKPAASLYDPETKRKLTVYTSSKAVVCYSDNFPTKEYNLVNSIEEMNNGITFETITPNFDLNDIILRPNETYTSLVKYKFS